MELDHYQQNLNLKAELPGVTNQFKTLHPSKCVHPAKIPNASLNIVQCTVPPTPPPQKKKKNWQ